MNPYVAMALFGALLTAFFWAGRWLGKREGRRMGYLIGRADGLTDALALIERVRDEEKPAALVVELRPFLSRRTE